MKISTEQLNEQHLIRLDMRGVQSAQHWVVEAMKNPKWFETMVNSGPCCAFIDPNGVAAIGGIIEFTGSGRGMVWAIFAHDSGEHFVSLYRKMRQAMLSVKLNRYEAYINPQFKQARRLASLAGFEREGLMRKHENGIDKELWALT
jgi:RimJ/RimL family protein N-acetyltransferase